MIDYALVAQEIMRRGPDRVMINSEEGVPSRRARDEHNVNATIIFIRDDGWSLGAPPEFEADAYRMWADKWVAFMHRPETEPTPISEYKQ